MDISGIKVDVGALLTTIPTVISSIRSAITGEMTPEQKAKIEQDLLDLERVGQAAQNAVNLVEAQSPSLFVSGWRPAVGWICVAGLGMHFVVNPMILWVGQFLGRTLQPPVFDAPTLMGLVVPLLGLGAYRTYEKTRGSGTGK